MSSRLGLAAVKFSILPRKSVGGVQLSRYPAKTMAKTCHTVVQLRNRPIFFAWIWGLLAP